MVLTPMPALQLASVLLSWDDGGLGGSSQDGTKMGVTLAGQKPLALSFWQSHWPDFTQQVATSRPLETTEVSSKGGGRGAAGIVPPTGCFAASSSSRRSG